MDPVRLLLVSSTAVLSLMLLIEWNQYSDDYQKDQAARYAEAASRAPATSSTFNGEATNTASIQENSDIPTISTNPSPVDASLDAVNLAYLDTDTLNITIAMAGGDIVDASLPQFPTRLDTPDQPFLLLESSTLRTYVAQSGLIGPDGIDVSGKRAEYISLGTKENSDNTVTITLAWIGNQDDGIQVFKRFTAADDRYFIDVDYTIINSGSAPATMTSFAQLKRDNSEAPDGNVGFGVSPYLGAALSQPDERYTKLSFSDLADEPFAKRLPAGWVAILQHYFVSAWVPDQNQSHDFFASKLSNGDNVIGYKNASLTVQPDRKSVV